MMSQYSRNARTLHTIANCANLNRKDELALHRIADEIDLPMAEREAENERLAKRIADLEEEVEQLTTDCNAWRAATGLASGTAAEAGERIDALDDEVEQLRQWVSDCQSGMYINCVYCGHRYGPKEDTPVAMADVLKAHIEQCSKHPLSHAKKEIERLTAERDEMAKENERLRAAISKFGGMVLCVRKQNTNDFMDGLADAVNVMCKAIDEGDRYRYDGHDCLLRVPAKAASAGGRN